MIEQNKAAGRLAQIKDRSLSERGLIKELGLADRKQLIDALSNMSEEEADQWLAKLNFGDRALVNAWVSVARDEKAKAAQAGDNHSGEVAVGAALVGGALTAEAGARLAELISGTEQTYNANIVLTDLYSAFSAALQNSAIKVEIERSGSDEGEFVLFDDDGQELLRVQVRNSQEKALFDEVAYDATEDRFVGRAYVRITKSDMENLFDETEEAAKNIVAGGLRLKRHGSPNDVIGLVLQGANFISNSIHEGKEVFDIGNLPRLLANEIEKLAQAAEELQQRETRDIKERNETRLKEVKGGLVCLNCNVPRPEEETSLCEACGAPLQKRTESVVALKKDKERLARVGLTF